MASHLFKLCTAALAGSLIGVAFERWQTLPNSRSWSNWNPNVFAASSIVPSDGGNLGPPRLDTFDIDPKTSGENLKRSAKYGLPSKDNIRVFNDFILSYDRRLRAPVWVIEHLSPEKLKIHDEKINRDKSNFKEDTTIHEYFRAKNTDFARTGFDRGHMAAAGNHKVQQEDLDQTFVLSNVSPQVPEFNRGGWERLEAYVRWRAKRSKDLLVVTGPLYLPLLAKNGNLYVTYQVIGNNHVSVPTHYFKVILAETEDNRLVMEAFLMPNDPKIDENTKINDYRIPIDRLNVIERASGVIFFDQINRKMVDAPLSLPDGFRDESRRDRFDRTQSSRRASLPNK